MVSKPFQAISAHWATPYTGQPRSKHGQGPDAWNCWSFFRHVQQAHFGVETPMVPYADDLLMLARLFRDHRERSHWHPVTTYREGDGVMMRTARYPFQVRVLDPLPFPPDTGGERERTYYALGPGTTWAQRVLVRSLRPRSRQVEISGICEDDRVHVN